MKFPYSLIPLLFFTIFSCNQSQNKKNEDLIKQKIIDSGNFIKILEINFEKKTKGKVFSFQKFKLKIKFLNDCAINLNEDTAVPKIETSQKSSFYLGNLMNEDFSKNDEISVSGIFYSSNSSSLDNWESRCLFYLNNDPDDINKELFGTICSDLAGYENAYLSAIKLIDSTIYNKLSTSSISFADKSALRLKGAFIYNARQLEKLAANEIDLDRFKIGVLVRARLLYYGIELINLNCN